MVLAGVLLFFNWKVNRNALFLSLLMVMIATAQVRQYLILYATEPFWLAIFTNNFAPMWSMTGACLFFYVRSVLTDRLTFRKSDLLHNLPFWVNLAGTLPYILTPFSYKLEVANLFIHKMSEARDVRFNAWMGNEMNLLSRYAIQIGYALACLWMLAGFHLRRRQASSRSSGKGGTMIIPWLLAVSVFVLLVGVYYFVGASLYFRHPSLERTLVSVYREVYIIGVVLTFLPSLVLVFPEILYGIPRQRGKPAASIPPAITQTAPVSEGAEPGVGSDIAETAAEPPASVEAVAQTEVGTQTTADPMQELGRRVLILMERDKPYLSPDFSIEQLADMLEVPRHHVYYCFKNVLKTKFVSMRTEYRVNEAKMRLLEADLEETTLYAIGRSCGFSSHSAFYRIFNEAVGCSPGEFIERSKHRAGCIS